MDLPRRLLAEVVGTFGFLFVAFAGIATVTTQGLGAIGTAGVAAGFGFGLAAMIFALGHISGGHDNPAVSAGLAAAGRFPVGEVVPYWIAQVAGGVLAAVAIRVIFDSQVVDAAVNVPGKGIDDGQVFAVELIVTFLFVLVVTTVAADARAPWNGVFAPFAIGLFIFTALVAAGPVSGGSYNPARSLAPAIVAGKWSTLWIYLLAPTVGGILAGLLQRVFAERGPVLERIPEQPPGAGSTAPS